MILAIAGVCVAAPSPSGTKHVFCPPTDVLLTFSMERRHFRIGRDIVIDYRITNISLHPLFIPQVWSETCPAWPHVGAWLENRDGKQFASGYSGDCNPEINSESVKDRMAKEAVLLQPAEHLEGTIQLQTGVLTGLVPGAYRVNVGVRGWKQKDFNRKQWSKIAEMRAPLLTGEVSASASVRLTP